MKKMKHRIKRNKKRKIIKKTKSSSFKIGLKFKFFILIIMTIFLFIFNFLDNEIKELKEIKEVKEVKEEEKINPNYIMYKGSRIQKNKLWADYFSRISFQNQNESDEKQILNELFNLSEYSTDPNIKNVYKIRFMNFISELKGKPVNKIDTFYMLKNCNFGNCLVTINNLIFYCEIIGCHRIIFFGQYSLIRRPIYIKELNISIITYSRVNCEDDSVLCLPYKNWNPYYTGIIKPQIRTQYLKEEIMRNIPQVNIDPKALYVNIRGGHIFMRALHSHYSQPPLCFYEKVIDNNKFQNIYIISNDRRNVVLDALMNKYKNIIFNHIDYKTDVAMLVHAFNVVASVSSFFLSSIKFNDNLENLWEYDICRLSEKYRWLHHHLYKFDIKYKIHTMKPSDIYADQMHIWKKSDSQLKLMIEDKCPYDFVLTKPN